MKLRGMGGVSWGGVGIACYIPFSTAVHVDGGGVAVVSGSWGSQGGGSERAVGRGSPLNVARSGVIGQTEKISNDGVQPLIWDVRDSVKM